MMMINDPSKEDEDDCPKGLYLIRSGYVTSAVAKYEAPRLHEVEDQHPTLLIALPHRHHWKPWRRIPMS